MEGKTYHIDRIAERGSGFVVVESASGAIVSPKFLGYQAAKAYKRRLMREDKAQQGEEK